jgi:hypothetical protein
MLRIACLSAALLVCAPALAQSYGGIYTAKNASGGTVTLTLAHDDQKQLSGTLTGHGSTSLQVQARIESDGLRGTAANNFGMLYLRGFLRGEELRVELTEADVGGRPNPQRSSELRLAKTEGKKAPQNLRLSQALTANAWCSSGYDISGKPARERLVFMANGFVKQTPGTQARWRVQNETLEFSPDGVTWSQQPLRLALGANGSPLLQSHSKEYLQCD